MNKSDSYKEKQPLIRGLNNIGATFFLNATLQCLFNTKELTDYFQNEFEQSENKVLTNEYNVVIKNLLDKNNNNKPYSQKSLQKVLCRENPVFLWGSEIDSNDLIKFLLERFHQELNASEPNKLEGTNENLTLKMYLDDFKKNPILQFQNYFMALRV